MVGARCEKPLLRRNVRNLIRNVVYEAAREPRGKLLQPRFNSYDEDAARLLVRVSPFYLLLSGVTLFVRPLHGPSRATFHGVSRSA